MVVCERVDLNELELRQGRHVQCMSHSPRGLASLGPSTGWIPWNYTLSRHTNFAVYFAVFREGKFDDMGRV